MRTRLRRRVHGGRDGESGMATAEFAVALPAVTLVLALVVGVAQLMLLHHRTVHAASVGARLAARGESAEAVRSAVDAQGLEAHVEVDPDGAWVGVRVSTSAPMLVRWAVPEVEATSVAARESTFGDEAGPTAPAVEEVTR